MASRSVRGSARLSVRDTPASVEAYSRLTSPPSSVDPAWDALTGRGRGGGGGVPLHLARSAIRNMEKKRWMKSLIIKSDFNYK